MQLSEKTLSPRNMALRQRSFRWSIGKISDTLAKFFWGADAAVIALRVLTVLQWQALSGLWTLWMDRPCKKLDRKAKKDVLTNGGECRARNKPGHCVGRCLVLFSCTSTTIFHQWHRQRGGYLWRRRSWKDFEGALQQGEPFFLGIWCRTHFPFLIQAAPEVPKLASDQAASQHKLLGGSHSTLLI